MAVVAYSVLNIASAKVKWCWLHAEVSYMMELYHLAVHRVAYWIVG